MFRIRRISLAVSTGFPRVRGDVPADKQILEPPQMFSPRARGCSLLSQYRIRVFAVFPACAGMFLYGNVNVVGGDGFPRVRGDVPFLTSSIMRHTVFSPRARGCSLCLRSHDAPLLVFPACAGMFLKPQCNHKHSRCFPRVRGDVPAATGADYVNARFSPRARGCSAPRR